MKKSVVEQMLAIDEHKEMTAKIGQPRQSDVLELLKTKGLFEMMKVLFQQNRLAMAHRSLTSCTPISSELNQPLRRKNSDVSVTRV